MKAILKYGQITYKLTINIGYETKQADATWVYVHIDMFRYNSNVTLSTHFSILADESDSPRETAVKIAYNCENIFNKDTTFNIKEFFSKYTNYTSFITSDEKTLLKALNNVPILLLQKFHCNFLLTRQGNRECYRKKFMNEIQKRINLT